MPISPGDTPSPRYLYPDAADFLTPAGQAINADFLAEEETVVRRLAAAARLDDAASA